MAVAMAQTKTCPRCSADITTDALRCSKCGSVSLRCPKCGTVNADVVEFCNGCGGALTSSEVSDCRESDYYGGPYVVWEGFPFAWLHRTSQSRDQYFRSLAVQIALLMISSVFMMLILVPAALNGDAVARPLILVWVIMLILITIIDLTQWWFGRKEAERRRRRAD